MIPLYAMTPLVLYKVYVSFITSMPNPVKSLGYIKCYSSTSPKPVKSPSNSITYNYKKICKFFENFTNHRKRLTAAVFSCTPFPNILKYNLENKTSSDTY